MSVILPHIVWPWCEFKMQVWNVLHAARSKYRTQKVAKKSPSGHHCTILSGYIFATKAFVDSRKNLLSSNISSTCRHNMVNFGPLAAEICAVVWGTPANFNGFRVLASLLQRRRSTETNQTLHDVWPSFGLVDYIYIHFRQLLLRNGILPDANFTLRRPSLALCYWQCFYCTALEQWARAKLCSVEHRAPPIFGRATITLSIRPHSSLLCIWAS